MSQLEDLVPPLEYCKEITEGHFADSALVWRSDLCKGFFDVFPRECGGCCGFDPGEIVAPAPTLAEILDADHRIDFGRSYNDRMWVADAWDSGKWTARNAINPATAALRLWLEVNGVASDGADTKAVASDETQDVGHNGMEVKK